MFWLMHSQFSRLPRFDSEGVEGKSSGIQGAPQLLSMHYTEVGEPELHECLKYLPELDDYYGVGLSLLNLPSTTDNPLSYSWLKDCQDADTHLTEQCAEKDSKFEMRQFGDIELICY